jgi:hypothetical protein
MKKSSIVKIPDFNDSRLFYGFFGKKYGNVSYEYGVKEAVDKNIDKILATINIKRKDLYDMVQVHGNNISVVKESKHTYEQTDGLVTNNSGRYLLLRSADCFPIILYAAEKKVLGLLHAGWKGATQHIIEKALIKLNNVFNLRPNEIAALVGPGIHSCCYQHKDLLQEKLPEWDEYISVKSDLKQLDLHGFLTESLKQAGVKQVYDLDVCTGCDQRFFSHYLAAKKGLQQNIFATIVGIKE